MISNTDKVKKLRYQENRKVTGTGKKKEVGITLDIFHLTF